MGNNHTKSTTEHQTPAPKENGSFINGHIQHFQNTFMHFLQQENEVNQSKGVVSASTILKIFPPDLKHVGQQFVSTLAHPFSDDETSRSATKLPETIGDSSFVVATTSVHTRTPDGGADSFLRNSSAEEKRIETIVVNERQFVNACRDVCEMDNTSSVKKTRCYTSLCNQSQLTVTAADCVSLLMTCCAAAMSHAGRSYRPTGLDERITAGLVQGMYSGKNAFSADGLHEWLTLHGLPIFDGLHSWLSDTLRNYDEEIEQEPEDPGAEGPRLLSDALQWLLSMTLRESFFTTNTTDFTASHSHMQKRFAVMDGWELLYDSDHHGLSINRFEHHVLSYHAPSILLVISEAPIFYVTCGTEWRKGGGRFGGPDSDCVQVLPKIQRVHDSDILTWADRLRDHTRGISIHKSGSTAPIAFIPHDFSSVKYYGVQYTIQRLQVFGCGDESARDEQFEQKQWERRQVQKSQQQKLHLEQNWNENADRKILEMAGIQTNHAKR